MERHSRRAMRGSACAGDSSRSISSIAFGSRAGSSTRSFRWSGCSRQQHGAVRDQVRRRVVAGDDQHEAEAEELGLREPHAVDLGGEERAREVVARLAPAGRRGAP